MNFDWAYCRALLSGLLQKGGRPKRKDLELLVGQVNFERVDYIGAIFELQDKILYLQITQLRNRICE